MKKSGEPIIALSWGQVVGQSYNRPAPTKILALHGLLDNCASFEPLLDALELDAEVLAIDLPGHGKSAHRPAGSHYHLSDWLGDIEDILDALGWTSCWLLGHSMGGALAAMYAAVAPERVSGLLLIEGLSQLPSVAGDSLTRLTGFMQARRSLQKRGEPKVYPDLETLLARRLKATPMPEEGARLIMQRNTTATAAGIAAVTDARLGLPFPTRLMAEQIATLLSGVRCPAWILRAVPGFPFPDELWVHFIAQVQRGETRMLAGGHYIHMEAPQAVARELARYFQTHAMPAAAAR